MVAQRLEHAARAGRTSSSSACQERICGRGSSISGEARGIRRISAIGGRTTASALIDEGLVQDLTLTTSARPGGEPDTPFYVGKTRPSLLPVVRKRGTDPQYPILVEQD